MEIIDDTEALRRLFAQTDPGTGDVESVHQADLDAAHAMALMADPKAAIKAMGIPVSAESRVEVTMKPRASRDATASRIRRIIVIVIHYRNCDSDIIIIAA